MKRTRQEFSSGARTSSLRSLLIEPGSNETLSAEIPAPFVAPEPSRSPPHTSTGTSSTASVEPVQSNSEERNPGFDHVLAHTIAQYSRDITLHLSQHGCADTLLLLKIKDLAIRLAALDQHTSMSGDAATATKNISSGASAADASILVREKQNDIVKYVTEHGCPDVRLNVMILELGARLELVP